MGLALVEKLLRTTEVKDVYLLLRPKKGKLVEERLEELTRNPVRKLPSDFQKVFGICVPSTLYLNECRSGF